MNASRGLDKEAIAAIAASFDTGGPVRSIEPLGRGLINDTFRVDSARGGFVLQRINGHVFPHPERIMANLRVLRDLGGEAGPRIPGIVATREGDCFTRDRDGALWRMLELIPNARSLPGIDDPTQAYEVGRLLGGFHAATVELPIAPFQVSLPGLHETPGYLERLWHVLDASGSGAGGDAALSGLLERIETHRGLARRLEGALRAGDIARHITHGDPKLDNILFSADGTRALALIDLDTVQPGLIQHDLGDCLRSCCNRRGEGAPDPASTRFDAEICEGILGGYAEVMRGRLSPGDLATLYDGMRVIPFELGVRFLTDYLEGDRYFRIDYPGQNLIKARIQLALVEDIERQEDRLRGMIRAIFGSG